jgi:hypothetical protein
MEDILMTLKDLEDAGAVVQNGGRWTRA